MSLCKICCKRAYGVSPRDQRQRISGPEIAGYALRVGKGGPKMKESTKEDVQPADENGPPPEFERDAEGFLILPSGEHMATGGGPNGVNRVTARAASMDQLAATLGKGLMLWHHSRSGFLSSFGSLPVIC
jgi:uncharacterized protein (TIGR03435 family)